MVSSFAKRPVQTAKAACPGSPKPARRLLPLPILPLLALPFLAFTIGDTRAETSGTESGNGARQPVHSAEVTFGVYALGSKGVEMRLATKRGESAVQVDTAMKTAGMLDWDVYLQRMEEALAMPPSRPPTIGIPVVGASAAGGCH